MVRKQVKKLKLRLESGLEAVISISPMNITIAPADPQHHMEDKDIRYLLGITLTYEMMHQRDLIPSSKHVTEVGRLMVDNLYDGTVGYFQRPTEMKDDLFQTMMQRWEGYLK